MSARKSAWPICAAAVVVLIASLPFFRSLVSVSAGYPYAGHVTFVPVFAAILFWLERHRFRGLTGDGRPSGGCVTVLALALLGVGYRIDSVPLQALSFAAAVAGIVLWWCGVRGVRHAAFVLAFLLLMVPPPQGAVAALAPGIQHVVAAFSAEILESFRIPVAHQDIFLHLPALTLKVAEECAGLRFSLILFVFVSAFARAVLPTISGQLMLMSLAIPVAMLANAMRVAVTSVGAYAIGPQVATGPLHYYIGKSFWALAILAMIALAGLLRARTNGGLIAHRPPAGAYLAGAP